MFLFRIGINSKFPQLTEGIKSTRKTNNNLTLFAQVKLLVLIVNSKYI